MSVADQAFAVFVLEVPSEAARLGAGASVGRATADDVAEITLTAI